MASVYALLRFIDLQRAAIIVTVALLGLHLWAAGHLEFMFDEAYYSLWAQHLAWGYHDHPPGIAFWIRASTSLFGNSEFGARALGAFATAAGSLAIYAIATDLFADRQRAALAVLIWNACPLIGVGAILVTPDTPLLFGWTLALWGLGRVYRTGDWRWWMVVGIGAGLALEAKYTALFLGPGIVLAMIVVPQLRRWWRHPAPYAGGLIALALFVPNVVWNAQHGWQTFGKQFGRVAEVEWTFRFLAEFLGSQIGLLGPLTFVLAIAGLLLAIRGPVGDQSGARRLLAAIAAPLLVFFAVHSLHDRVQGNWVAPLFPVLALLAADAAMTPVRRPAWAGHLIAVARVWTVPVGLVLTGLIYLQAFVAPLPLSPRADPTALLSGWRELAADLAAVATKDHSGFILTQGYALTGLLKVYGAVGPPVFQFNERQRWTYDPAAGQPDPLTSGLYIVEQKRGSSTVITRKFDEVTPLGHIDRRARGRVLETYEVYRVGRPTTAILDPPTAANR